MNTVIPKEQKLSLIMDLLVSLGCNLVHMEYEEDLLELAITLDDETYEEDEEAGCPCFDPDEDDEDEEAEHCIHCCPECGTCMLGLGGEDC